MHNIARLHESLTSKTRGAGYEVRIFRRGQRETKFFSDGKHGGPDNALQLAQAHRDKILSKMAKISRYEIANQLTARNTSGIRGIRVRTTMVTKGEWEYHYEHVEASWSPEPGKVIKKSFSVAKLGMEKAWGEAVKYRAKALSVLNR